MESAARTDGWPLRSGIVPLLAPGKGSRMTHFRGKPPALVATLVGVALMAGAVGARTAAAAMATPKKATASTSAAIVITNSRSVALTELDATPSYSFIPKAIAHNIAPGKKASVNVATDKDCVFDLHGSYADGSSTDSKSVNLCNDKNVNLVD
jgi:hypothetical protein